MKKESNKNWTTCLRLNIGDGSPRVFFIKFSLFGVSPFQPSILYNTNNPAPIIPLSPLI